jgi:hypothetical protein
MNSENVISRLSELGDGPGEHFSARCSELHAN